MEISAKLTKQITEAKYLTEENCYRYRPILRYFFLQYEKIKYWMYKEEVFEELKNYPQFDSYTVDNLKNDLDRLVEWGNLIPVQDTSRASTIEEFKNKQFRYQLSEYSVEFERFCIRLENLVVEGASLEASLFERVRDEILKIPTLPLHSPKDIGSWWRNLDNDFKRLNHNYQDYIRSFNSASGEEKLKSQEFLIYKDSLVSYLREFVKELQRNVAIIENALIHLDKEHLAKILGKVLEYEKSIPRIDVIIDEKILAENIFGKWDNFYNWFVSKEGIDSEASKIFDITNDIIRKITRYASQIAESRNSAANRKEDYKKVCEMFLRCTNFEDLNKFSSIVFGLFSSRHLKADLERKTESINGSVYDEEAHSFLLKPRIRTYGVKADRRSIEDKSEKKEKMKLEILRKLQEEKEVLGSYIKDNKIEFAKLPQVPSHVRVTLLKWLGKGFSNASKKAKTEDGREYKITYDTNMKQCVLKSYDGDIEMPAFIIEFY